MSWASIKAAVSLGIASVTSSAHHVAEKVEAKVASAVHAVGETIKAIPQELKSAFKKSVVESSTQPMCTNTPNSTLSMCPLATNSSGTSSQPLGSNQLLTKFLNNLHKNEGGYVDDPTDKGGKTKYGIAENREWPAFAKFWNLDPNPDNIKNITADQADAYYIATRFDQYRIMEIKNEKVANAILDQSILTPGKVNLNTKKALNSMGYGFAENNDRLSDEQLTALNAVDGDKFVQSFTNYQVKFLQSLNDANHIKGWTNRLNGLNTYKP